MTSTDVLCRKGSKIKGFAEPLAMTMLICEMKVRHYHVYILTNKRHTVLYTGITGNLPQRLRQHKQKQVEGFTSRYNVDCLVYFEEYTDVHDAIAREKQIKAGSRQKKLDLINQFNPTWQDLSGQIWRT